MDHMGLFERFRKERFRKWAHDNGHLPEDRVEIQDADLELQQPLRPRDNHRDAGRFDSPANATPAVQGVAVDWSTDARECSNQELCR
jgi:hypothetical protein